MTAQPDMGSHYSLVSVISQKSPATRSQGLGMQGTVLPIEPSSQGTAMQESLWLRKPAFYHYEDMADTISVHLWPEPVVSLQEGTLLAAVMLGRSCGNGKTR